MRRQDAEPMSDPHRQVALRHDIKLLQAANECYCCVPTLFKPDHPPTPPLCSLHEPATPSRHQTPHPTRKWDVAGWKCRTSLLIKIIFHMCSRILWYWHCCYPDQYQCRLFLINLSICNFLILLGFLKKKYQQSLRLYVGYVEKSSLAIDLLKVKRGVQSAGHKTLKLNKAKIQLKDERKTGNLKIALLICCYLSNEKLPLSHLSIQYEARAISLA